MSIIGIGAEAPETAFTARVARASETGRALLANKAALAGLVLVALLVLAAAGAPVLAPYDPNAQELARRLAAPAGIDTGRLHSLEEIEGWLARRIKEPFIEA